MQNQRWVADSLSPLIYFTFMASGLSLNSTDVIIRYKPRTITLLTRVVHTIVWIADVISTIEWLTDVVLTIAWLIDVISTI